MALFDSESEQIVIGSILQSPDLFFDISQSLSPNDFYFESHRIIYETIAEEFDKNNTPDVLLIISSLKNKGLLESVGNRAALMAVASLGSPLGANTYAKGVKELSLRRQLLQGVKEVEKNVQDLQAPMESVFSQTEKMISQIADKQTSYNVIHVRELKTEFLAFLQKLKESQGGITGLPTSFKALDQITTGLKGGQLIILAARPGAGKTTLALNIASRVALKSKKTVLIFSLEMTRLELLLRMICAEGYLDSQKIQKGFMGEKEMQKLVSTMQELNQADLYIDDSSDMSSWDFRQRSRRLANQLRAQNKKIDLIVVDYLQLMSERGRGSESRQLEVANISRSLKIIAKELDVPVMALSQMNRSIEQRGKDPRPQLSDLRESGAIEQDADIVMFIHREDMFVRDLPEELKGQAEIIIAKHRAGPTGSVNLMFIKEKNLFMDLELHEDEPGMAVPDYEI